nr:PREDICTED: uncharacterized protein LOC108215028 isoform X3 [Daucus carota subsp. sativus]
MQMKKKMSLRKCGMQQSVDTSKLRRSTRIRQSSVAFSPEKEVKVQGEMGIARCGYNKRKQKALAVEEDQHQTHLAPSAGQKMQPVETRDEVPVVELPASPIEEKPKVDLLFLLEHAMKPNSREEVLPEDRKHLENAAFVLKSQLVARLTCSTEKLKTEDKIDLANRCYRALRELGDDYRTFNMEVYKFIAQQQELEFAAKDKENWNDGDLKARYNKQQQVFYDVTGKLFSAQDKLSRTTSHVDLLKFKKAELTSVLLTITKELFEEEKKLEALKAERDKCKEVHLKAEAGIQNLDAEKNEASMALEAINVQYDAAKEEFERMSNHLLQLVRRSPSNQAAAPSTTSFSTAGLTKAPSTVSPQPIGVSSETQACGPAIGASPGMTSPSATQQSWCCDPSLDMFL